MKPINILLIEDNAGDILLISEALGRESAQTSIHVAVDGEQAIEMLAKRDVEPDVVILDLTLPKLCGLSFLKLVRLVHRSVPIVVFSSSCRDDDIRTCFELGVRDFITKPTDLESYRQAVSYIVRKWGSPQLSGLVGVGHLFDSNRRQGESGDA